MLCTAIGKFDESFRYGQLALDLLKKFRTKEYLPRVFAAVYGECQCNPLLFAVAVGCNTDVVFSARLLA